MKQESNLYTPNYRTRAADRISCLLREPVLNQVAANIMVNAPVALFQCAFENELNGILLGLGLSKHRIIKLPITDRQKKDIIKALHDAV